MRSEALRRPQHDSQLAEQTTTLFIVILLPKTNVISRRLTAVNIKYREC